MNCKTDMLLNNIDDYISNCKQTMLSHDNIVVNRSKLMSMLIELRVHLDECIHSQHIITDSRYKDDMLNLITKKREVTSGDIELAKDYLSKIPCRDFVYVCGTGIGCSNCPHYHLQMVFDALVDNFNQDK